MTALFTPAGRDDPAVTARSTPVVGCGYAFATAALHDRRLTATPIPPSADLMFQVVARFLSRMNDERHSLVRTAFTGLFSPRRIERYRGQIESTSAMLIDALPSTGPLDIVRAFARPLPFTVICNVLGVPAERQPWLAERMEAFGRAVAGQRDHTNVQAGNTATREMLAFFDDLLSNRQHRPLDDVVSLLAASGQAHEHRDDLLANCIFFILAGHATTTTLITAGVHLLSTHPAQLASVQRDPSTWPDAVEELLRLISPATLTGVTATEDTKVANCPVPEGATRAIVFAAANRDPTVFAEPDTFDVTRTPNPHLAFSAGARYCLGAPLARLHAEVALTMLFTRLPGLHTIGEPTWLGSVPIRQVARLDVDWSPPRGDTTQ